MKRVGLLLTFMVIGNSALAADMPPPVAPLRYDWTGFYVGGNLGAAVGSSSFSDSLIPPSSFSSSSISSFIGGGQLGLNYEFGGGIVVGAEAMFDWLSNTPTNFTASNLRAGTAIGTINNRWITTVTGKLGYAWDRLLVYGKGGGAWIGTDNSLTVGATPAGVSVNFRQPRLDRRRWGGMGFCPQVVGPRGIRLYRLAESELHGLRRSGNALCRRQICRQQSQCPNDNGGAQLQTRCLVINSTAHRPAMLPSEFPVGVIAV
jgi:opacity protein-like surface antigen